MIKKRSSTLHGVAASNEISDALTAIEADLPEDVQKCGKQITIACIRALYNLPNGTAEAVPGNEVGTFQQGSYFSEEDINNYFKTFAPHVPQGTFPINATIDGASYSVPIDSELNTGEGNLDVDVLYVLELTTYMLVIDFIIALQLSIHKRLFCTRPMMTSTSPTKSSKQMFSTLF